jgi:hypothetical protein
MIEKAKAELARRHFHQFVKLAWDVTNPGRPLMWGSYLQAICDHLQAVKSYLGDPIPPRIRKLAISLPPNTLKSFTISVCWPSWLWTSDPSIRFLCAANDGPLATRDALAMRTLVESDWYTQRYRSKGSFAGEWGLAADQDEKTWFSTTKGGHRISYSVNARVTGKKGDVLIVDDANDARKVNSLAERNGVIEWHDMAFSGRIADEKTSPEVIAGQRTHKEDLIGHCLKQPGWVHLCLSEDFDPSTRCTTPIGYSDPRTQPGEFLRPERFGAQEKADRIAVLGTVGYDTQHNQKPVQNLEGNRFKKHWFRDRWILRGDYLRLQKQGEAQPYEIHWKQCLMFGTVDGAASSKTSACHTVIGIWLITPRKDLIWWDCDRFQLEIPEQVPRVQAMWTRWNPSYIGIEAVLSNVALAQLCERAENPTMTIKRLSPLGEDKLVRATQALVLAESGKVWLPAPGVRPTFPLVDVEGELWTWSGLDAKEPSDCIDNLSYAAKLRDSGIPATSSYNEAPMVMGGDTWV